MDDLSVAEVRCCECGKPVSSIPAWLAGAQVKFQCEECRQKHPRIPGMADMDPRRSIASAEESPDAEEVVEDVDEEAEDEISEDADEIAE